MPGIGRGDDHGCVQAQRLGRENHIAIERWVRSRGLTGVSRVAQSSAASRIASVVSAR